MAREASTISHTRVDRRLSRARRSLPLLFAGVLALAAVLTVAGCGGGTTTASTVQPTTTSSAAATTTLPAATTTTAVTEPTTTSAPASSTTTSVTTNTNGNAALIKQTLDLARQGKVVGIPFTASTNTIDQVQSSWGAASSQDFAGAAIYFTYPSRHAAIGINKGDQIIDIRSSGPQLQVIVLSQVTSTLGSPGILRHLTGQDILLYPAGPDYQLLWVFPRSTSAQPDPHLDHVSVFYPAGTVDLMAQNVPDPSVLVTQAPGSSGSLFTFSIKDPPPGYTLAELEWIPSSGPAVITTLPQATAHGTSGGSAPYFAVGADGVTWSFGYTSSMKSQSGVVRLVYQNTDGAAIIGKSDTLTLN